MKHTKDDWWHDVNLYDYREKHLPHMEQIEFLQSVVCWGHVTPITQSEINGFSLRYTRLVNKSPKFKKPRGYDERNTHRPIVAIRFPPHGWAFNGDGDEEDVNVDTTSTSTNRLRHGGADTNTSHGEDGIKNINDDNDDDISTRTTSVWTSRLRHRGAHTDTSHGEDVIDNNDSNNNASSRMNSRPRRKKRNRYVESLNNSNKKKRNR